VDKWSVSRGDKYFYEDNLFFADPTIFEVFTFPLLQGNPNTALQEPNSMIVTETMAQKYFGKDDPVGKVLTINDTVKARITGIARDVPENTHFRFDFLVCFESMPYKWALNTWKTMQFFTYILLDRDYSQIKWEKKLSDFLHKNFGKHANIKLHFQPIDDIHLHSKNYNSDLAANKSDIAYIFIFSTIVFFILGIACINFMNLSTARSAKRAKEVGVRKVVGAHRGQLIKQFLGESLVFSFFAGILAIFLVKIFLPAFNSVSGKNITFTSENIFFTGGILAVIIFVVGFISGSYPSLLLSAFQPIKVLKGMLLEEKKSVHFRRILVVFQFTISLCLIIGTFIIHGQIDFCVNKNLGFEKDHVVVLPVRSNDFQMKYESFRITLLNNPRFISVSGSSTVPGRPVGERGMFPDGNVWHPRNSIFVDYDFLPTLGIEIKEGRNFSRDFPTDVDDAYIVNEAAVKNFGWDQAINKKIFWAGDKNKKGHVIGVVKDFHYKSFHQKIEPLVLHMTRGGRSYISVRVSGKNLTKTMSFLKNKWLEFNPGHPFDYFFLDDNFDTLYRAEEKMGKIIRYFTFLALFISCLGLFGLASYILEQRTKEIGIRKVLGASSAGIVVMLSKEFLRWVLIANILAWPIVYFAMNRWLQNFAYRTNISVWVFLFSAAIVLLISLVTISYQSMKTAAANPVDSLRYE
jgi:putative ABC transport system permease protein